MSDVKIKSACYGEIQPERDISGNAFAKGQINLNWSLDQSTYFNPAKSYIKIRVKLNKRVLSTDTPLANEDHIAPNMFFCDNLFQSMKMKINNQCVSEIGDYVPQIASLKKRMSCSEERMNNYVSQTNFTHAYYQDRLLQIVGKEQSLLVEWGLEDSTGHGNVTIAGDTNSAVDFVGADPTDLFVGDAIITKPTAAGAKSAIHLIDRDANNDGSGGWFAISRNEAVTILEADYWIGKQQNVTTLARPEPKAAQTIELIWKPPLGFWDIDAWVPGCQALYNLELTPQPDGVYQIYAVETDQDGANFTGIAPGDINAVTAAYTVNIVSMNMYLLKGQGPPAQNKNISFQLLETRCQSQNLTTTSLHQKTFQVNPTTKELTLAYQYPGAGISSNRFSASKFRSVGDDELKLTRFWISYSGKQLPTPIPDLAKIVNVQDYYTQRYVESIMYANELESPEPYQKWIERGPYYHFSSYDPDDHEDRVFVSQQFSGLGFTNAIAPNVLLFDHFIKKVSLNISGSIVKDVTVV